MYFVDVPESVESYVLGADCLPELRRLEVLEACRADLAANADHFLLRYPVEHESLRFAYSYALAHGGAIHSFRFIVDGSAMASGVVRVLYVDREAEDFSSFMR